MSLEHLNHLVELLISPIRAQLADAPLNSGLTDSVWCGLIHCDLKNWPPVITELIQHAHDSKAVRLASSAVLAALL